jgi:twitching motility protein PilT
MDDTRLGAILLENPLMRQEDLERCLEIQELTGGVRPLGEILIEEGVITQQHLDELLAAQRSRRAVRGAPINVTAEGPDRLLSSAVEFRATDLILSEGRPPLLRVGNTLRPLSDQAMLAPELWDFVREHMGPDVLEVLAEHRSVTNEFTMPGLCRGRATAFRHFDGICVTVRLHPNETRAAQDSRLPVELTRAASGGKGLIILTGEVCSGISETITTLVAEVAASPQKLIIMLDDTFESPVPEGGAVVLRRRVGVHARSYVEGLQTAISERPDLIVIGDATDPATLDLAMRAAETGLMVIAVVRSRSVLTAIEWVLNNYPTFDVPRIRAVLAATLSCVAALHLVPGKGGDRLLLATEVLGMTEAAREIVRVAPLTQLNLLMRLESAESGHSLDDCLVDLIKAGEIGFEDAFRRAEDKTRMLQAARNQG